MDRKNEMSANLLREKLLALSDEELATLVLVV
jgi:hypothetical protein